MKNIIEIFRKDIKEVFRKTNTWIIIVGLIFLPSMYAWPNILSSWDPYGHTNNIKVAVTSEDEGATVDGKELNLGNSLVEGLKNNKNLDWQFVSNKQQAEDGVRIGDYYASIVVPKNFSQDMTSVSRTEPKRATIEYTVNEKINAISPKITNSGASAIANNISKNFVETANGIIFERLHEAGIKFEENLPSIEKAKEEIFKLNDNFSTYESTLSELIGKVEYGYNILNNVQNTLPEIDRVATNSIMIADKAGITINNIQGFNERLLPIINNHLNVVEEVSKEANVIAKELQQKPDKTEEIKARQKALDSRLQASTERLQLVKNIFEYFNRLSNERLFNNQLERVTTLLNDITTIKEVNNNIYNKMDHYDEIADTVKEEFVNKSARINEVSSNMNSKLNVEVAPLISQVLSKAEVNIDKVSGIIAGAQGELPAVERKLSETEVKISNAYGKLLSLQAQMPSAKSKIQKLTDEIKKADSGINKNQLFNLLKVDYKQQAEFFANPVKLQENKLYHIENYGSAMTPFYTVLSIWVGSLLMSSLLTTKVEDEEKKYKPYQKYFGRGLLFVIISLFQTLIITLGDMYVLGTQATSPYRFVLYALLISLLFSSIIYTIVCILGNVGKAVCIVLLVLQLGSSGGTFPIQMTSEFFQALYPKVPFTYSIGLLREAVGGVYIPAVERDIKILFIYLIVVLVGGAILVSLKARSAKLSRERERSKLFL
ncbi:YhgE/Pip family protein [Gemella haemolysans]|uniref:YhgE/Pip domain protein n=1 Tax=Gemella haemolysans ATCC 10379 TaxID=546270 RepID=C5NUF9_9BACL|nr:YhgE/Pip domain-containing protein [Gemella haemolysans]EER69194.1 YhgE/Pip domain protein [Gemella haemolysans ATCC 10379]KAA8706814.1 YhgE/Pip domain-containing protein [Gemella haemolysans]UBH82607.1 YhgE/Pip domain-containing protein [Gemella haemolysans]